MLLLGGIGRERSGTSRLDGHMGALPCHISCTGVSLPEFFGMFMQSLAVKLLHSCVSPKGQGPHRERRLPPAVCSTPVHDRHPGDAPRGLHVGKQAQRRQVTWGREGGRRGGGGGKGMCTGRRERAPVDWINVVHSRVRGLQLPHHRLTHLLPEVPGSCVGYMWAPQHAYSSPHMS
jgi:hypothetical protein